MTPSRLGQAVGVAVLASLASPAYAIQSDTRPLVIFEGRVSEEFSGAAIEGAQIDFAFPATAVTDSTGRYRLEARHGGTVLTLSAVKPGFFPESREQQLPCDHYVVRRGGVPTCHVEFDFEMRRSESGASGSSRCTIRGTVLRRNDRSPLAGAVVRVDGTEIRTSTGYDGAYLLPDVPAGLHRVTARGSSSFGLSRLVVARCASPRDGPTLPLLLSPMWIP